MNPELLTPEALQPVLDELQALEPIFHSAYFDATPEKFERYVASQFWEVGASGNRYSRAFAFKVLSERQASPDVATWRTSDWHLAEAGPDNYLLTYTLFQPGRVTRRLSVWRRAGGAWQVIYHQGTVVQEPAN
ncbi:DUF4440 domain-containing protein [Niveibacterium sp. SC-1]|uniref:nuclear transport factor 2 family protein n=1 Tax=Niveibacterium sp. SC-1 TaxID=3135646 RepID=UPI00311E7656